MFSMFFKRTKNKLHNKIERPRFKPNLEALESRLTPSNLTVGPVGSNANFTGPNAIQNAVNASSPGGQIQIQPGTYTGQVVIGYNSSHQLLNGLQIQAGNPSQTTIQAPATLTGIPAEIDITSGVQNVLIQNVTVNGNSATQFNIRVDDGSSAVIHGDVVTNALAPNSASIMIGRTFVGDDTVGTATVTNTTVSGYSRAGIAVDSVGSYGDIENDTVIGLNSGINYGVQISNGGNAAVLNNTISNNNNHGAEPESAGILVVYDFLYSNAARNQNNALPGAPDIENNVCDYNQDGIFVQESSGTFLKNNKSSYNGDDGITMTDSNYCVTLNNQMNNDGRNGIGVYGGDAYTDFENGVNYSVPIGGHDLFGNDQVNFSGQDGYFTDYQFTSTSGVPAQDAFIQEQATNCSGAGFDFQSTNQCMIWQCQAKTDGQGGYIFQPGAGGNYNNVLIGSNTNMLVQDQAQQNTGNGFSFIQSSNTLFVQNTSQQNSLNGVSLTNASDNNTFLISQSQNNTLDGFVQSASSTGNFYGNDQSQGNGGGNYVGIPAIDISTANVNADPYVINWCSANGFNMSAWTYEYQQFQQLAQNG